MPLVDNVSKSLPIVVVILLSGLGRLVVRSRSMPKEENGTIVISKELESAAVFASTSAFQPVSVGLGFRVIPALGGGAQQFQP